MYFGTLVTPVHRKQEMDNWQRDIGTASVPTPGRWHALRKAFGKALQRAIRPFGSPGT